GGGLASLLYRASGALGAPFSPAIGEAVLGERRQRSCRGNSDEIGNQRALEQGNERLAGLRPAAPAAATFAGPSLAGTPVAPAPLGTRLLFRSALARCLFGHHC